MVQCRYNTRYGTIIIDYDYITIRNYYNKTNQKFRMHTILKLNNNSKERKLLSIPLLSLVSRATPSYHCDREGTRVQRVVLLECNDCILITFHGAHLEPHFHATSRLILVRMSAYWHKIDNKTEGANLSIGPRSDKRVWPARLYLVIISQVRFTRATSGCGQFCENE